MKNGVYKERQYVVSGERLRKCRKAIGLTQEQLAEEISKLPENRRGDRSFKTIGKMERGMSLFLRNMPTYYRKSLAAIHSG